jgi:serine/threonine protein phosphatase PrpC
MTSAASPKIEVAGLSNTGKVREDNQDAIRMCKPDDPLNAANGYLYGIADGMGGYSHGGVASALALSVFFETFYTGKPGKTGQAMRNAIQSANIGVFQHAQKMGRMGTTLTAVNLTGNKLHIAHIGDSRAYLIRNGKSSCLTNDHTMVGELVRMHLLSPDKVRTHAQRSKLDKCLGMELFIQPDITEVALMPDDIIILCTDGVWSVIQDDEFAHITGSASGPTDLSQRLIDMALDRDSDDNVSVVTIHVERLVEMTAPVEAKRGFGFPQLIRGRFTGKS